MTVEAEKTMDAETVWEAIAAVDRENVTWFNQVVADSGWPGRSAVGEDGANAALLLAQHADSDPAFQRRCLDLMMIAATRGEATKSDLAYLTDRVLLAEGKPQEFGTQTTARQGQWVRHTLRDPENVDKRRAAMSLEPLAEYLPRIAELYGPSVPATTTCQERGLRRILATRPRQPAQRGLP